MTWCYRYRLEADGQRRASVRINDEWFIWNKLDFSYVCRKRAQKNVEPSLDKFGTFLYAT